jgi:RNA recognition motif-containing protein
MSNKVFVGGLSWDTDDEKLQEAFESVGTVTESKVIKDRDTGRSRGFGFVTFDERDAVQDAIRRLDGTQLDGRTIRVNEAEDRRRG